MQWHMPAEWEVHNRTWMAWPCNDFVFELIGSKEKAWAAWADTANAIAKFEPVIMICDPRYIESARQYLDATIKIITEPLGDSWMRDAGPTFVRSLDGKLGGVDWSFNGWGGRTFPEGSADAEIARLVCKHAGVQRFPSLLVNEGGAIHVDGEGTLLLTETVQLNRNRNPNWQRSEIEAEFHAKLGTKKTIWIPRGLIGDTAESGTDGHVDTLTCFIKPGVVVVHGQPDPTHPDFETAKEIHAIMSAATDAKGRKLEVITLNAPQRDDELPCSYVNFSFVNGGVVLCGFDNETSDSATRDTFTRLFNDRQIVQVPALDIFRGGGGVHCITQQEPA